MKKVIFYSMITLLLSANFACKNKPAGDAAETGAAQKTATMEGSEYTVDAAASKVLWEGAKPAGKHHGTINVSSGVIGVENGKVTSGKFTIDMNSINVLDLQGDEKLSLEAHLKGTAEGKEVDFFDVQKFPTASFVINKVTGLGGAEDANSLVYGNLTIKDVTKEISFKAMIDINGQMIHVTTPQFTINRTDWGIKYGSKTFFDNLKDKFIEDNMGISINLMAKQ